MYYPNSCLITLSFCIILVISAHTQSVQLDVEGALNIFHQEEDIADSGTIRWTGFDFEVWNGDKWVSLTSGSEFSPYTTSGGNIGDDYGYDIHADNLGNILISGSFASDSLFFPNDTLLNTTNSATFLAKYRSNGDHQWSIVVGSVGDASISTLSTDKSGNIYIGGSFTETFLSLQHLSISGSNTLNLFMAKLDPNGKVVWLEGSSGEERSITVSMKEDVDHNLYVLGRFQAGDLVLEGDTLKHSGGVDVFIAKYGSTGNLIWSRQLHGSGNDIPTALDIGENHDIYLLGYFNSDTLRYGNNHIVNQGLNDVFAVKMNSSGQFDWMKRYGSTDSDFSRDITVADDQTIFLTGYFKSDSLDFDGQIIFNSGNNDFFLAKLDQNGNASWANTGNCVDNDFAFSVVVSQSDEVYIAGDYYNSSLSLADTTLANQGEADFFVAKYTTAGQFIESVRVGENLEDRIQALTIDNLGNVFGVGYFSSNMLTFEQDIVMNQGGVDFYFAKFY